MAFSLRPVPQSADRLAYAGGVETLRVRAKNRPRVFGEVYLKPVPAMETYTLSGLILNAVNKEPIPDAVVQLRSVGATATTTAQGLYAFEGLDPGVYNLRVARDGFIVNSLEGVTITNANIEAGTFGDMFLCPSLPKDTFSIIVRWGATPRDLDSSMLVEGTTVKYNNR